MSSASTASYSIRLLGGRDPEPALLTTKTLDARCQIELAYRDRVVTAQGGDFFDAFCRIREQLAEERLVPACYGASLNVYPSAMARDMGRGLSAYRLTLGEPAKMSDLVDIFAEGPDITTASVRAQREFFEKWLAHFRSRE